MNDDEIKEILDKMFLNCDTQEEKNKVLDYITNLQQELEKRNAYIKYLEEYNPKYYKGKKFYGVDYKSRCEKAVEYIEQHKFNKFGDIDCGEAEAIINILNGRSDE